MARTVIILAIFCVGLLPLWGCGPTTTASGETLEARVAKLERDLKALEVARDTAMSRADTAEKKLAAQLIRTKTAERERDELLLTIKNRQSERDAMTTQFDGFKSKLRDLLGQMENTGLTLPAQYGIPAVTVSRDPLVPTVLFPTMNPVK